jgi:hypothetical protein
MTRKLKSKEECPSIPPHYVGEPCDCRERVDCKKAGEPGHMHCGICKECEYPTYQGHDASCSQAPEWCKT